MVVDWEERERQEAEAQERAPGLHAPVRPYDVRQGERIGAEVRWSEQGVSRRSKLRVWRLSPLALELLAEGLAVDLPVGMTVDLTLTLGARSLRYEGLTVAQRRLQRNQLLLGLRWHPPGEPVAKVPRFSCSATALPTGLAANPLRANDFIYFRVLQLSAGGALIATSLRNNLLLPGLHLEAQVSFAGAGHERLGFTVVRPRVVAEGVYVELQMEVAWARPSPHALETFTRYLQHFGPPVTPAVLGQAGLPVLSVLPSVELGYVQNEADYRQVLALRQLAYERAGKLAPGTPLEDTADVFDRRARILIARHRGMVIASLRLMFHGHGDAMEHEQYLTFPADFPPRQRTIEVTRVCTHPDFRGGDLLYGLFKHGLVICAQSGRRWVVGSATPKLLKLYTRLGFQPTALRYRHAALGNEEHVVFKGDLHGALTGQAVNPFLWNALYADVWNLVDPEQLPRVDLRQLTRMRLYRLARPFAHRLAARLARPSRRGQA